MTDAEVIEEFQRRRLAVMHRAVRPSVVIVVSALLLVAVAQFAFPGWIALSTLVVGMVAIVFGVWVFVHNTSDYRCPRCGAVPALLDGFDLDPKHCRACNAK